MIFTNKFNSQLDTKIINSESNSVSMENHESPRQLNYSQEEQEYYDSPAREDDQQGEEDYQGEDEYEKQVEEEQEEDYPQTTEREGNKDMYNSKGLEMGSSAGSQLKSQLMLSKIATKEVEMEAQSLRTRIQFLEKKEEEMLKKINDTKDKAIKIMQIKQRNKNQAQTKEKISQKRQDQLDKMKEKLKQKKDHMRKKLEETKMNVVQDSHSKASEIRENLEVQFIL